MKLSKRQRAAGVAVLAAGLAVTGTPVTVEASATTAAPVQPALDHLVTADGFPGALLAVRGGDGRTRRYTAGVADLVTNRPVPVDGRVRIGSNTKPFVAVAVLQLVGEGKVDLEAPIDTYLPGLIRGQDIDGRHITVRQILQHTSGLPDYSDAPLIQDIFAIRHRHFEPSELLGLALAEKARFAPGAGWGYSNTNYIVAGLIIEKVTGRPAATVITERVIKRAGLRHTTFPTGHDETIPGPHPHGYHANESGEPLRDVTSIDPSWAGTAGAMISTNTDLTDFYTALLGGRLLKPAQLRQMTSTVPTNPNRPDGPTRYGLGLFHRTTSCGVGYWGHGGDIPGYETRGGVADNGRAVNLAVTALPDNATAAGDVENLVDAAICA
ncbi:serine hydrolase [Actinoplanes sp. N902-109]|uniref:serine hydrolase domain-containing protein n=1 Tax=Actinoplanes sp. (strain N902-109) TaxID=649831 RepID=UPI00032950F1|nr:serine hydrolase domain-containing protein [Actinoplanes sp. N902-109]AGL16029.1 Serine-type D-Ala-D-Ala carboxypeptidase [Actinoplanes sp. N902-109]